MFARKSEPESTARSVQAAQALREAEFYAHRAAARLRDSERMKAAKKARTGR